MQIWKLGFSSLFFLQFLLIYHKAKAGQLDADSGLHALAKITEVDITQVGVDGAKFFFEAKVMFIKLSQLHQFILLKLYYLFPD